MDEAKLYEIVGRQHLEIEDRREQYRRLLGILAGVVGGGIEATRLMVNLTDQTWALAPEGLQPATPATINGLPVCVVAPVPMPPGRGEAIDAALNGEAREE